MDLQNADFSKSINANILDKKLVVENDNLQYIDNPELELKLIIQTKQVLVNDNEKNIIKAIIKHYRLLLKITILLRINGLIREAFLPVKK